MCNRWVLYSLEIVLCWFLGSPFTFPLLNTNPQQLLVSLWSCAYTVLRANHWFLPSLFSVCFGWFSHWQPILLHWFCPHSFKNPWNNSIISNFLTVCWWSPGSDCLDTPGLELLQQAWEVRVLCRILLPVFYRVLPLKKNYAGCISETIPVKNEKPEANQTPDALQLSFRWRNHIAEWRQLLELWLEWSWQWLQLPMAH